MLSYGDPDARHNPQYPHGWSDYVKELGLSLEDLPHLMRMLKNPIRYEADSEDPRIWVNVHAWRAIGQLCAKDAVHDLLDLIDYEEDEDQDDWAMEEIPVVLAKMGLSIFPVLSEFINDMTKSCSSVSAVSRSLVTLQEEHPELREQCISSLSSRLAQFKENDSTLSGFLISSLIDLKAVESLDLMDMAFQENEVDLCVAGDIEDVEIALGVREKRDTPQQNHLAEKLRIQHLIDKWRKDVEHEDCHPGCHHEKRVSPLKQAAKIGRNDPCLCGSGKKYKKCCLQ